MSEGAPERALIRPGEARDLPAVIGLVRALADFEKLAGPDEAAAARFAADLGRGRFRLLVADQGGVLVGYALYFYTYSTFLAQPSLYLEDLFVQPAARGRGLGGRFMRALAAEAAREGCGRFEWCVLDWNVEAQKFYRSIGAAVLDGWWICRLEGEGIKKLGSG